MRKARIKALCALVCFALLSSLLICLGAAGMEIGTNVTVEVEVFKVTAQTEDCTLDTGDDLELMVDLSDTVASHLWELSTDDGTSWTQLGTNATYEIVDAQPNTPPNVAYRYRYTATSAIGTVASTVIRVLVSDAYDYRTIALRDGDTDVSAYMHDKTRLVITPLPENSPAATELESQLSSGTLALMLHDISLVNTNNEVAPYFGTLRVDFHVGSAYDGETLKVHQLVGGDILTYSGIVSDGVLSINATALAPILVEVPASNTHVVTATAGDGGSITPSGAVSVPDGSDKTFTFLPNEGYEISTVTVDDVAVDFSGNSYTLTNIEQDTSIYVGFQAITPQETLHTISINAPARGSVYPSGSIQVQHGSAQTIYFYPEQGYELNSVIVNGALVNVIGNSYTLSAVTADTTVIVSFTEGTSQPPDVYKTIAASAGANGSISPMADVRVEYGGDLYFYFVADAGYEVDEVIIDDTPTAVSGDSYHFVNVVSDRSIQVSFKQIVPPSPPVTYYTISASSGSDGTISPSGNVLVREGYSQTFSFIPNAGFEVDSVIVDGKQTSVSNNAFSFTDVRSSHTISVSFKKAASPKPPSPVTYHTITALSGANGTISPKGEVQIAQGQNACFSFLADEGYEVDVVTVDGVRVATKDSLYNFENVTASHTIQVTYKQVTAPVQATYHTIDVLAGEHGSISPSGKLQIEDGKSQVFYLIADDGYEVEAIYVNDEKQDIVGSQFTIDDVTSDTKLRVTFTQTRGEDTSGDAHCFICAWIGTNCAPWCWIVPLIILIVIAGAIVFYLVRRRRE